MLRIVSDGMCGPGTKITTEDGTLIKGIRKFTIRGDVDENFMVKLELELVKPSIDIEANNVLVISDDGKIYKLVEQKDEDK